MATRLVFRAGPYDGKSFDLFADRPLVLGREVPDGLELSGHGVSRKHCKVELHGETLIVTDLESTNGTFVGERRITRHELRPGGRFRVGQHELEYVLGTDGGEAHKSKGKPMPRAALAGLGPLAVLPGNTLGQFKVGDVIAKGANSVIFRATDTVQKQAVALKVLWPEFLANEEDLKRLVRAVKAMKPIRHPNLVAVYGAGKTDGFGWVAMEHLEGRNVARIIREDAIAAKYDWKHAFQIAVETTMALDELFRNQIVYRNLVPRHIIVGTAGKSVKLIDLALAKPTVGNLAIAVTTEAKPVGEFAFMSPEQAAGDAALDTRSDIYGLGAALYAMLSGTPPFRAGSEAELLQLIRVSTPTPLTQLRWGLPEHLSDLVTRMMAKNPADRFETPAELLKAMERTGRFIGFAI